MGLQQQGKHAVVLAGLLGHLAVGIAVVLRNALADGLVDQMIEAYVFFRQGNLLHASVHLGEGVYVGGPFGAFANEEPQLVVGGEVLLVLSEEQVPTGDVKPFGAVGLADALIEIVAQLGGDQLVGIDHKHPVVGSRLYGKGAGRLSRNGIAFGECHHAASILSGNIERAVGALHIANQNLIELLDRFEHFLQMLLGIVGVDDHRYFLSSVSHLIILIAKV